jgi:hypothetical protein
MERFDPCGTAACKKKCDSLGVCCEELYADEIERLRKDNAQKRYTVLEMIVIFVLGIALGIAF